MYMSVDYNHPANVSQNAISFAQACVDQNSISDLENSTLVDMTDCATWDITPAEWYWAIAAALYAKQNDSAIMDSGRIPV